MERCEECETRKRHVAESKAALSQARTLSTLLGPLAKTRTIQPHEHQYAQALKNLEHHERMHGKK